MASAVRGTLCVGVTSALQRRIGQHREGATGGFTTRYAVQRLVHFERFGDMAHAIAREKQLKAWRRDWKINLIQAANPDWRDLAVDLDFPPLPPVR